MHLQSMYAVSPPESVHALYLGKLRAPEITFWSACDGWLLLRCGALKQLDPIHGEIKSMRTPPAQSGAAALAAQSWLHIIAVARVRNYVYESFGSRVVGRSGSMSKI